MGYYLRRKGCNKLKCNNSGNGNCYVFFIDHSDINSLILFFEVTKKMSLMQWFSNQYMPLALTTGVAGKKS